VAIIAQYILFTIKLWITPDSLHTLKAYHWNMGRIVRKISNDRCKCSVESHACCCQCWFFSGTWPLRSA